MASKSPKVPDGMVALRNASGSGCGFAGVVYEPDANGWVVVPVGAALTLADHGYSQEVAEPEAPAEA